MLARTVTRVLLVIWLLVEFTLLCCAEAAEDWPCFRGPTGMGVVQDDPVCPSGGAKQRMFAG